MVHGAQWTMWQWTAPGQERQEQQTASCVHHTGYLALESILVTRVVGELYRVDWIHLPSAADQAQSVLVQGGAATSGESVFGMRVRGTEV